MQMVMNRKFLLQGLGHAIRFEKNKPVGVPPRLVAEARKYGAIPAEGEDAPVILALMVLHMLMLLKTWCILKSMLQNVICSGRCTINVNRKHLILLM